MDKIIIVDKQDKIIGFEEKEKCHDGYGILHRAFSVFIFNDKKELLIQQRSKFKRLWPLYWSNTCCSHPRFDEEIVNAAEKRIKEEFGFWCLLKDLYKFQYQARFKDEGSENEMCSVLIGKLEDAGVISKPDRQGQRVVN